MGFLTSAVGVRVLATVLVAWTAAVAGEQAMTVRRDGPVVRVRAPAFTFIDGDALTRLRDGRALQFEFTLAALAKAGGPVVIETRQRFNVSFDLWEERFAVTRLAAPRRSVSHLRAREAEGWCLDHLTLPHADLAHLGREGRFWTRLSYQVHDSSAAQGQRGDEAYSLRRLIDYLSQRRQASEPGKSVEAGPFRVPE
jgi:hypothetical protein